MRDKEKIIEDFLKSENINYETEKSLNCINNKGNSLFNRF